MSPSAGASANGAGSARGAGAVDDSGEATGTQKARGKVVWSATMSLDGFIAGPDDAMGWVFDYSGSDPVVDELIGRTGAVLAGRRSYDAASAASARR